jgi:hypothetical protein
VLTKVILTESDIQLTQTHTLRSVFPSCSSQLVDSPVTPLEKVAAAAGCSYYFWLVFSADKHSGWGVGEGCELHGWPWSLERQHWWGHSHRPHFHHYRQSASKLHGRLRLYLMRSIIIQARLLLHLMYEAQAKSTIVAPPKLGAKKWAIDSTPVTAGQIELPGATCKTGPSSASSVAPPRKRKGYGLGRDPPQSVAYSN